MHCETQLICTRNVRAGSTIRLMAQIESAPNELMSPDDVQSVRVDLYDLSDGERTPVDQDGNEITDGSAFDEPEVSDVVHVATTEGWLKDSIGANVSYLMRTPAIVGNIYEVRITITDNDDRPYVPVWKLPAE